MELPDTISLPPKPSQQRSAGIRPTNRTAFLLPTANIRADIFYAQPIPPFPLSKIPAFIKESEVKFFKMILPDPNLEINSNMINAFSQRGHNPALGTCHLFFSEYMQLERT